MRSGTNRAQLKRLVDRDDFSPAEFAQRVREGETALTAAYGVSDGVASQLRRALDEEQLSELELMSLDDRVEIALDVGTPEHSDHRPLERLSGGSAAPRSCSSHCSRAKAL